MVKNSQEAALRVALSSIGADAWLEPSTVLASANLRATQRMIRELAAPDEGGVCMIAPTDNGCRRFYVEPDEDGLANEVLMAMSAAGCCGAEVAVNVVAPGGYGRPRGADITALRAVTVQFRQGWDETEDELLMRAFGNRFDALARREQLNPLTIRDTIEDRYCAVLELHPIRLDHTRRSLRRRDTGGIRLA